MLTGRERRNKIVALVLAGVLVASVLLALLATVASASPAPASLPAHAELVSVVPADGARLSQAPTEIVLTFNEPVPPGLAKVVLMHDGTAVDVASPTATDASVTAAITGPMGPGAYRIAWRATSDDGHPVSGESGFTVTGGATQVVAEPRSTPTYKTPQTQPTPLGHPDHLPGLIVAALLLLAGVALLIHEQRRRRSHPGESIS